VPHLLLDVRSEAQFSVVHLRPLPGAGARQQLQHVPLAVLQGRARGGAGGVSREERSLAAVQMVEDARRLLGEDAKVYVLCRRGVDSVAATQRLRAGGCAAAFNVRGGLRSWSQEVDPKFPVY